MSWPEATDPPPGITFDGPIPDQRDFRRKQPAKDLREFFRFLEELESVFGRMESKPGMKGTRFLL
ncbi:MAG: hypothetical protein QOD06_305 [Candidatus Binatota bacterium]|nr:hypothetical protein [Candidatus Binatota bacterium]